MNATPGNGFYYMPTPKLTPNSPRLSTALNPFVSRLKCQRCGRTGPEVRGWIEHDHEDKPEPVYVFLCKQDADNLIESHPRLYSQVMPNAPLPGIMDICGDCRWRDRSRCTCPLAILNGGPGIEIQIEAPTRAFICTRPAKNSGLREFYASPATGCSGKAAQ